MKKLFYTLTFILFTLPSFSQIGNAPIGCFLFSGNANDHSGNNRNGTVHGATLVTDRFGNANSAYSFNGTTSYIDIPGFGNYIDSNETSVSIWCKTNQVKLQCLFMLNPDITADRFMGLVYYNHSGDIATIFDHGDLYTSGRLYYSNSSLGTDWEHYVFVTSKKQNVMRVYKNGVKLTEASQYSSLLNHNRNLFIGGGNEENTNPFFYDGLIDDVQIYNEALTDTEIQTLFAAQTICSTTTAIANHASSSDIFIYPNPSSNGIFHISGTSETSKIEVFNSLGQIVFSDNFNSEINLTHLSKGTYFLKLISRDKSTQKVISIN